MRIKSLSTENKEPETIISRHSTNVPPHGTNCPMGWDNQFKGTKPQEGCRKAKRRLPQGQKASTGAKGATEGFHRVPRRQL